jgi:hypothetical protein
MSTKKYASGSEKRKKRKRQDEFIALVSVRGPHFCVRPGPPKSQLRPCAQLHQPRSTRPTAPQRRRARRRRRFLRARRRAARPPHVSFFHATRVGRSSTRILTLNFTSKLVVIIIIILKLNYLLKSTSKLLILSLKIFK